MRRWSHLLPLAGVALALAAVPASAQGGPPYRTECQEQLEDCLEHFVIFPGDGYTGAVLQYEDNGDGTFTDLNTWLTWQVKTGDQGLFVDCLDEATMPEICYDVSHVNNRYPQCADEECLGEGLVFTFYLPRLNATCEGQGEIPCQEDADCGEARCGLGGFTDWRLPTVKELESLWNHGESQEQDFPGTREAQLAWSSTDVSDSGGLKAWGSNDTSVQDRPKQLPYYVRVVRDDWPWMEGESVEPSGSSNGGPPYRTECQEELAACLSLSVVFPGDGYTGAALSYQDNKDGTFTDLNTGLIWQEKTGQSGGLVKCKEEPFPPECYDVSDVNNGYTWSIKYWEPDGSAFTFYLPMLNGTCEGEGEVSCMNDGDCPGEAKCGLGGHQDWRLPTVKELGSLWNYADGSNPGIPGSLSEYIEWSSTSFDSLEQWHAFFLDQGRRDIWAKDDCRPVRAVRDDWDW